MYHNNDVILHNLCDSERYLSINTILRHMQVVNFDHTMIPISNALRSKDFYSKVLGLKQIQSPKAMGPGTLWFKCAQSHLHLVETDLSALPNSGLWSKRHVALDVTDLKKAARELKQAKVKIDKGPVTEYGLFRLFCFDPDGNRIEIRQK